MFELQPEKVGSLDAITLENIFDDKQLDSILTTEIEDLLNNVDGFMYFTKNTIKESRQLIRRQDISLSLRLLEELCVSTKGVQIGYIGLNIDNALGFTDYRSILKEDMKKLNETTTVNIIKNIIDVCGILNTLSAVRSSSYRKNIVFINTLKGASFLTKFKELDFSKYNINEVTFERLKDIELELMENRFDNTTVLRMNYQDECESIIVLTNRYTWQKIRKTVSKVFDFFPNIAASNVDQAFLNKVKFLFEKLGTTTTNDNTAWQETLFSILKDKKRMIQRDLIKLEQLLENTWKERQRTIQATIRNNKASIESCTTKIEQLYALIRADEGKLLRLEKDPELKEKIQEALEYANKSKLISKLGIIPEDKKLELVIDAPIRYYDPEYAKVMYKNMSTGTYSKNDDITVLKELFKETFIENKYTLYCSTLIDITLYNSNNGQSPISFYIKNATENKGTYLLQPHLNGYACLGNNKIEALKACEQLDILGLLTVFTTSAQNFNLTDSTVFNHFREKLLGNANKKKTFKNNETGEMFSFDEYYAEKTKKSYKNAKTISAIEKYDNRRLTTEEIEHLLKALKSLKTLLITGKAGLQLMQQLGKTDLKAEGIACIMSFYNTANINNNCIKFTVMNNKPIVNGERLEHSYYEIYDELLTTGNNNITLSFTEILDNFHNVETNEEKTSTPMPF